MTAFAAKNDGWSNDDLWSPEELKDQGPGGPFGLGWVPAIDTDGNIIPGVFQNSYTDAKDANGYRVDISWRELSKKTLDSINEEGKVAEIFFDVIQNPPPPAASYFLTSMFPVMQLF